MAIRALTANGCARIHDYSATIDSRSGQVYLKIVNPGSRDMPAQLSFGGRNGASSPTWCLPTR